MQLLATICYCVAIIFFAIALFLPSLTPTERWYSTPSHLGLLFVTAGLFFDHGGLVG